MKVKVKIGDKYYMADASAVTALRYRARFNKSVIDDKMGDIDLFDLLFVAVGENIDYIDYDVFCGYMNEPEYAADMYISAVAVLRELMKDSGVKHDVIAAADEQIRQEGGTIYDEFYLTAATANIGLAFDVQREVGLVQLMYIIALVCEMRNGSGKSGDDGEVMSEGEMLEMFGVDVDTLEDE